MMRCDPAGVKASNASHIAGRARRALVLELQCHPKPGLVTPYSNGSHTDMDIARMRAGIEAIAPYFTILAEAGEAGAAFRELQRIGIDAEAMMMRATGGVNTHRGAIFGLGLLAAAAGYVLANGGTPDADTVCHTVADVWGPQIAESMDRAGTSHGAVAAFRYGAGGARAEAIGGMPTVRKVGVPAMRDAMGRGLNCNDASVQTLFAIMAELEDTNILYRAGKAGLHLTKQRARRFIDRGGVGARDWRPAADRIARDLQLKWISPGGAADVLSSTIFLMLMEERGAAWG